MTESDQSRAKVLQTIHAEIAQQQQAAETERDPAQRERRLQQAGIRSEVAEEEAAAISAETAENEDTPCTTRFGPPVVLTEHDHGYRPSAP